MSQPMDPKARYARTQKLFIEARALESEKQAAYLDAACGDDAEMRAELELLLRHDRENQPTDDWASSPVREGLDAMLRDNAVPGEPGQPDFIGEYQIRRKLGEGGMGTVYEAYQERLHRTVALKVLRVGCLSIQAERRFEHEAEFLGRLQHIGIGRIYDAGRAETVFGSQPYFAMELVEGESLTDYAQRRGLEATDRLRLVARVADAVQHAHQQGVIHRDLKPDNILVDATGQPKVLDFGIARASDLDTMRTNDQTNVGQILGTLAYMSPEQSSGDPASIDARTDVYALGVLLYELLAGKMPLDLSSRSLPDALRVIQDEQPRRLSTMNATLGGDVETIVSKALEKDKERRYATAAALAADLRHFVKHEPIEARPASQLYILSRFVRRNKTVVVATVLVFASLIGGLIASVKFGLREAARSQEVLQLSALQDVGEMFSRIDGDDFWPVHPDKISAYQEWLGEAQLLVDQLDGHSLRLDEVRGFAVVPTQLELEAVQVANAVDPTVVWNAGAIQFLERVVDFRTSVEEQTELPERYRLEQERADQRSHERVAELESLKATGALAHSIQWQLALEAYDLSDPGRAMRGEEPLGLALAQRAYELALLDRADPLFAEIADVLMWAHLVLGQADEAGLMGEVVAAGMASARPARRSFLEASQRKLANRLGILDNFDSWTSATSKNLAKLRRNRQHLLAKLERPSFEFEDSAEGYSWWHNELAELVSQLKDLEGELQDQDGLSKEHGWNVNKRMAFAQDLAAGFQAGGQYAGAWDLPGIRAVYPGLQIDVQVGLIPIGQDPATGYWEFAHLATGNPPTRDADGKLIINGDSGLVFVLLPKDVFWMGADNPEGDHGGDLQNFDPGAGGYEFFPHEVEVSAFFMSKYEMTGGQWERLTGEDPSRNSASAFLESAKGGGPNSGGLNPVNMVSWDECNTVCTRFGLQLPSEAQWEYAARGGTSTVWWTGNDPVDLKDAANLADEYARTHKAPPGWDYETWSDGYAQYAPVNAMRPNAFGLHNILGNVSEWCQDTHSSALYRRPYSVDPVAVKDGQILRMNRGGNLSLRAKYARSAKRNPGTRGSFDFTIGLRPARLID